MQLIDLVCVVAFYIDIFNLLSVAVRTTPTPPPLRSPPRYPIRAARGKGGWWVHACPACSGGASRRPLSLRLLSVFFVCGRSQPHHERMAGFTEMRLLRLLRLLSLLKVERQMRGLTIIKKVLSAKISQLIV